MWISDRCIQQAGLHKRCNVSTKIMALYSNIRALSFSLNGYISSDLADVRCGNRTDFENIVLYMYVYQCNSCWYGATVSEPRSKIQRQYLTWKTCGVEAWSHRWRATQILDFSVQGMTESNEKVTLRRCQSICRYFYHHNTTILAVDELM